MWPRAPAPERAPPDPHLPRIFSPAPRGASFMPKHGAVSRLLVHATSVSQAKAFAKAATAATKKVVDDVSTEVKLARQYEGASSQLSVLRFCCLVGPAQQRWSE